MAASDLTTLANVKQWLNVSINTDDLLLTRLITATSGFIQSYLNRQLISQIYIENRSGNNGNLMLFANYPATAVSAVTIDGTAIPSAPDVKTAGYRFDSVSIFLNGYAFTRGFNNCVLSYTAGYSSIPLEIEQACFELIGLRYKERDRIGHVSKSLGGETVAFVQKDMTDDVKTILKNYKKVVTL